MLSGKKILDLTWVLGGPFASQLLAQLGAEIIKIEPIAGDHARSIPPFSDTGEASFFLSVNRGKQSVALDLKTEEGMAAFMRLVSEADAVVHGFAPDVPRRLGIDFDTLKIANPKIVVAQLVGLHDEGEYASAPAFDLMIQAIAGVMSITGEEDGHPARVGYQVADLAGGLYLALATVSALLKAEATKQGAFVQVSLFDAQIGMLTWQAQNFLSMGIVPKALGARHAVIAPSDAYVTSDGRYIAIAPTGEAFWKKFCVTVGRPELAEDSRFCTATDRSQNIAELTEEIGQAIRTRPAAEWEAIFMEARVPAATVRSVDEALAHPVVLARKMVETVESRGGEKTSQMLGNPFKYAEAKTLSYPPALGEDTEAVLMRAGYRPADIAKLESVGAIRTTRTKSQS